eukprot:SAG31_NODE_1666_length_7581_cov_2.398022_5_plen_357_part_01
MAETVPEDGKPLKFGDLITLYDKQQRSFVRADGFNIDCLTYSLQQDQPRDTRCVFQICPRLVYQAQKRYKKALSNIGIRIPEQLEEFRLMEDILPEDEAELNKVMAPGGPLDKENFENEEDMNRKQGKPLTYGEGIQFRHINSQKWVTLSKGAGLQPGSHAIETTADGGEGAWWKVQPGFRVRKEGDNVVITDQIVLANWKKLQKSEEIYMHTYHEADWQEPENRGELDAINMGEINGKDIRSRYEVIRYSPWDETIDNPYTAPPPFLCSGDIVRLHHKEEDGFLTLGQTGGYASDDRRIHILSMAKGDGALTCSNSLWRIEQTEIRSVEEILDPTSRAQVQAEKGGNTSWEQLFRI